MSPIYDFERTDILRTWYSKHATRFHQNYVLLFLNVHVRWVAYQHGMARPQDADGADDLQIQGSSCEYIK
jgi:hypothetical protein